MARLALARLVGDLRSSHRAHRAHRRTAAVAVLACALAVLAPTLPPQSAGAVSQATVQAQIDTLSSKIATLDEEYNQAEIHLQQVQAQINDDKALSAKAQGTRAELVQVASQQAAAFYKVGAPTVLEAFLSSKDLKEFNQRMELITQVSSWESGIITKLQIADQRAQNAGTVLASALNQAQAISAQLASERSNLKTQLASEQVLLGQINAASRTAAARAAAARAAQVQARLTAATASAANLPALPTSGAAGAALRVAMEQIGKPYLWAGAGPGSFDCSGLTMFAYRAAGISLPHSAAAQYYSEPHVARSQLQPGDLVFYGSPIHHVGIYVGNGMMVHAPETGELVQVAPLQGDYVGAARPGV
ncbi:MAG TPA: NlpC/P60 family protein [Actinomycetota bacterium]|nr:NlpC/P60 family protein [Actinomycetota bacterium]